MLFTGFIAYAPVNTPVFSLFNSVLSKSDLLLHFLIYSSTAVLFSSVVICFTKSLSGANTQYVAPNKVSHLVVNTVKSKSWFATLNFTCAPTDFPIQFF